MSRVVLLVVAAVVRQGERMLLVQRLRHKAEGGKWEFPGGKVESGEDPRSALAREMHEELAVEGRAGRILEAVFSPRGERDLLLLFYEFTLDSGEPHPHDAETLGWYTAEQALALDLCPADREFLLTRWN